MKIKEKIMTNMRSSFKLLTKLISFNRALLIMAIIFVVFGIFMMVLSAFAGEPIGNEDYFISIASTSMGFTFLFLFTFFAFAVWNTRFFYSCPAAETIITRLIPMIAVIVTAAASLLCIIMTLISTAINGLDVSRISDLMLCCAYSSSICQIAAGMIGARSIILITYLSALPFFITTFIHDTPNPVLKHIFSYGFGMPVWLSAIILVISIALSVFISFKLARNTYDKRSTKLMMNYAAAVSKV